MRISHLRTIPIESLSQTAIAMSLTFILGCALTAVQFYVAWRTFSLAGRRASELSAANSSVSFKYQTILLGIIILLAIVIDSFFYVGFYGDTDDAEYFLGGYQIYTGTPAVIPLVHRAGATRTGMTAPISLVMAVSNMNLFLIPYFFIVYHIGAIATAWLLGKLFLTARCGFLSAALVALNPLFYRFAGSILPDIALTFWIGVLLLSLNITWLNASAEAIPTRKYAKWLPGVIVGVAFSVKESALIFLVPIFAYTAFCRLKNSSYDLVGKLLRLLGGFSFYVLLEYGVLFVLNGEVSIFRPTQLSAYHDLYLLRAIRIGLDPVSRALFAYKQVEQVIPCSLWLLGAGILVYPICSFITRPREPDYWLLWLMLVWGVSYLTVGTTSLGRYIPPPIQARYYTPFAFLGCLILGYCLDTAFKSKKVICAGLVFILVIAGKEFSYSWPQRGNIYNATRHERIDHSMSQIGHDYPDNQIVLSRRQSIAFLPVLLKYNSKNILLLNPLVPTLRKPPPHLPFFIVRNHSWRHASTRRLKRQFLRHCHFLNSSDLEIVRTRYQHISLVRPTVMSHTAGGRCRGLNF